MPPATGSRRDPNTSVLHVINGEHYAGAERVQDLLALHLPDLGYKVAFACVKPQRFAPNRKSVQSDVHYTKMSGRLDLRPAWKLARLLRDGGFALLHSHTPRAATIGRIASALTGVPHVHHMHSQTSLDSTHVLRSRISALTERAYLIGTAATIAVSEHVADYARRLRLPEAKLHVVPNGVPSQPVLPVRPPPSDEWIVGCIALFRPIKGLEVLVNAISEMRSFGLLIRLRVVGSFESPVYEQEIRAQIDRLQLTSHVDWVPFSNDVNAQLERVDLLVLPSLYSEGSPMVVLEAMAVGVPVVGSRIGGIPEVVRDGLDGILVRPGDPSDLARAIARIVRGELDWSSLRASAYRRQTSQFSAHSMAAGVARVYKEVLPR